MREGVLSVILPSYNEDKNVLFAAEKIADVLGEAAINFRLVFVDDGSSDMTWKTIVEIAGKDERVCGLRFSRNFGKESAIYAGLCNARTECVAVMDCDLQHPPEKLVEMYRLWQQGYDVIEGVKKSRGKESVIHREASAMFYGLISRAVGLELSNTSDFKLLDREVVAVIRHLPERRSFFRAMSFWVGFKHTSVEYEVQERVNGQSKWSLGSLVSYALSNIAVYSSAPMQLVTGLGGVMLFVAVVFAVIALSQKIRGIAADGFTTVILLQLFIGSITMLSIGIIGYYISLIYAEVQRRPRFIVSEHRGIDAEAVITSG